MSTGKLLNKGCRKLLVVSASVFPKRSGSAIVVEKLVSQFKKSEMAIFGELTPFAKLPVRGSECPRFHYLRSRLSFFGRGARFWSSIRRQFLPILVNRICNVARREQCDYILGVYPDELYCYAAYLAAVRLNLGFCSYFHNTYLDNAAIDRGRATEIQDRIFAQSQVVFVMSEGMKQFFEEQYGLSNCKTLVHSFEEFPEHETSAFKILPDRAAKIVLFGNFNESNLDATIRFCEAVSNNASFELHMYSDVPKMLLTRRGLPMNSIQYHGTLSHLSFSACIAELRKYDIVALTHGFSGAYGDVEYRTIFPTRTIPALLSGRPLIVHSPKGAFLTQFFRMHNAGVVVDESSTAKIIGALVELRNNTDLTQQITENAGEVAKTFYGPTVAQTLRDSIGLN